MAELTEDQLQKAADAYEAANGTCAGAMRAAAPFLRLPIDEPTSEEVVAANTKGSSFCMVPDEIARALLNRFVRARNAALLEKGR